MKLKKFWWLPVGSVPEISLQQFDEWLHGQRCVQVVDARTRAEYLSGTIGNAWHAPLTDMPVSMETEEMYKKIAGNRAFEILLTEGGTLVYLIGKFITFESASEYADLLKRNGYSESKVVAYLGSKEIPVETALQLFEK